MDLDLDLYAAMYATVVVLVGTAASVVEAVLG